MIKKWFGVVLALIVVGLVSLIVLDDSHATAPTFSAKNLQGQTWDNQRLQNKVTLINFWFPSCPGCVTEMPKLIKMAQDYQGKDFQILAVAVPYDPLPTVHEYAKQHALPFDVIFDEQKNITSSFAKKDLYPTSVLVNKRGEVLKTFVGEPNFNELYQTVDLELAK
ncbi:TlpA family protein disulfide reductase [Simonsiella muelleri]|uniref:Thioredoxin domain-containing protein n=1 Tax=Simonsiella muelleri ATCC 29453 TaxID=641147 RepID=V9HM57_9NEIS|nr:TlpA disulfide reductase family protein [Simonsiella muelleri]EFG30918.1 hypothetical protein HMPREF9021_01146 [Simonsiella muelleri ATCC 29453]UBQ53163.1 TlpA family protein disulfide reductase [Simonsiella muelleri]